MHEGRRLRDCLAEQDIRTLFLFLRDRGFSRSALAAASGLAETRVRSISQGKQLVTSYDVLVRIADGFGIDRCWGWGLRCRPAKSRAIADCATRVQCRGSSDRWPPWRLARSRPS